MNWPQLKQALLLLPKTGEPVTVSHFEKIIDEEKFVKTHIAVVDKYPKTEPATEANNRHRLLIAKPHYDRLLAYYNLKTQL